MGSLCCNDYCSKLQHEKHFCPTGRTFQQSVGWWQINKVQPNYKLSENWSLNFGHSNDLCAAVFLVAHDLHTLGDQFLRRLIYENLIFVWINFCRFSIFIENSLKLVSTKFLFFPYPLKWIRANFFCQNRYFAWFHF